QLVRAAVPNLLSEGKYLLYRPPPARVAELPDTVQRVIVSVPTLYNPPPKNVAELPESVQSVSASVPLLRIAPPVGALPSASGSPEMVILAPAASEKMPLWPWPSAVRTLAPGPVIVISAVMVGRAPRLRSMAVWR